MVAKGLRDAGYNYVDIDDCWMLHERDAAGHLVVDAAKFPRGMKALGDELHARGLLFGIYSAVRHGGSASQRARGTHPRAGAASPQAGNKTCEGYAASFGHEATDSADFAAWGVDAVKYDFCDCSGCDTRDAYTRMSEALVATGRAFHFAICSWGGGAPHTWGPQVAHSWRTGIDLFAVFSPEQAAALGLPNFLQSVLSAADSAEALSAYAGPGHVNDPDMLLVGVPGMRPYGIVDKCPPAVPECVPGQYITRERWGLVGGLNDEEQMSHLALWAMLAAPLIMGNDPRNMDDLTRRLLTAPGMLAIAQDANVVAGRKSWRDDGAEVWRRPLSDGSVALLLLNRRGNATADVAALWHRDVAPPATVPAGCVDVEAACADWAANGECTANARFMQRKCNASCPDLCREALDFQGAPPALDGEEGATPLPGGRQLYAVVVDAWSNKRVGVFAGGIEAHGLLPHASRLLRVTLVDAPPEPEPEPEPTIEEEDVDEDDEQEEVDEDDDEDAEPLEDEDDDEIVEDEDEDDTEEDAALREPPPPSRTKRIAHVPRKRNLPRRRVEETDADRNGLSLRGALMLVALGAALLVVLRSIRRVLRKRRKRKHRA